MGKYIKRFDFWNPGTWAIPQLYWDAFSNEQRFHAICKQLGKVIAYADYLGVNVDDIAARLKAIEEGQLDPYIIAAIEGWFEENEPEIVEALANLRTDVDGLEAIIGNGFTPANTVTDEANALKERTDKIEDTLDFADTLKVSMFDGANPNNFTVTLVTGGGNSVLFDTGTEIEVIDWIQSKGIEELDALVITHFHIDHFDKTNLRLLVASGLVGANTDIYRQMNPTSANGEIDTFAELLSDLNEVINDAGHAPAIVPENGSNVLYGDMKLTFWNTDPLYASPYDSLSWRNKYNPDRTRISGLNNYSVITRVDFRASSYLETGDIEGYAQKLNLADMEPVDVCKVPHHAANKMGVEAFFEKINPNFWILSNHWLDTDEINRTDMGAWLSSYIYRFLVYKSDYTPIVTNIDTDVEIEICYGNVVKANGFILDKDYNPDGVISPNMSFAALLPPDIYYENPYYLFQGFTIEDMIGVFRRYDHVNMPVSWYIPTGASITATADIVTPLKNLFSPINMQNRAIYVSHDIYMHPVVSFASTANPYQTIVIYSATGNDVTLKSWANIKNNDVQSVLDCGDAGVANGGELNAVDADMWNQFKLANILECTLASGAVIALIRKKGYPRAEGEAQSAPFEGVGFNSTATYLYNVSISISGHVTTRRVHMSDGVVDDSADIVNVMELRVIQ